ncbi:MAG: HupE/UreJ family protein [Rhodothermales bacterium]|nr:HupE/UreJ family protein [Rhodothermales bacterium]
MPEFMIYFRLGFEHLLDLGGADHILFLLALCVRYSWSEWIKVVAVVSFFTVGHSITLVLATLQIVRFDANIIEFLIPLTIFLAALPNILTRNIRDGNIEQRLSVTLYFLTMFFGLIHGLGFSNYLRALLGFEESIVVPLLAFNVGLELGQIVIVAVLVSILTLLLRFTTLKRQFSVVAISSIIAVWALVLMADRLV